MAKQQPKVPSLTKGPVPLAPIRDKARAKFLDIVDAMIGAKALVLDPSLDGCLGLTIPAAVLSDHGVEEMFHLGEDLVEPNSKNVIYISRANAVNTQRIANQIKQLNKFEVVHEYAVYFVPRRTCLSDQLFEEEGVKGDTTVGELPLDFIPFDEDVMSLELRDSFKEAKVDGDPTALYLVTRALMQFQLVVGSIPRMLGKGHAAETVQEMCLKMGEEMGNLPPPGPIKRMILFDRSVDLITPMVTQVTYEGMIDEILGIKDNIVYVNVTDRSGTTERKRYILNSSDIMHSEMRDVPWHKAAPKIRDWVQKMKHDWHSIKQDTSSKSVSEMKDFANRLLQLGSTEMHSNITEPIAKVMINEEFKDRINVERQIIEEGAFEEGYRYVEDLLLKGCDFHMAMRLLCLLCLTNNGIPKKVLDSLRKTLLLCYGYENLSLMNHLEAVGLLYPKTETRTHFPAIRRGLNLSVSQETEDETSDDVTRDVGYIYWGYAPISIRLIELLLKPKRTSFARTDSIDAGWSGRGMEAVQLLPGPHFDVTSRDALLLPVDRGPLTDRGEIILVVFLGGVTYSEISALRFLSKSSGGRTKFVIATSHITNGTTLLQSFQEENVQRTMAKSKRMLLV